MLRAPDEHETGRASAPGPHGDHDEGDVGSLVPGHLRVPVRFRVRREIGRGSSGSVLLADDRKTGRLVALKVVDGDDRRLRLRVRTERTALSRLSHRHVVRLVAHGTTDDGGAWIATEHVDGLSLDRWLRDARPDVDAILAVAQQLCDALQHIHDRGLIHRDLKARNVLITVGSSGPRVTLIDFDVACLPDDDAVGRAAIVGSTHTMSPEQVAHEPIDARSDLYALGVLLFRMLAGRYPYQSDVPERVRRAHASAPIPSVAETCQRPLPDGVDALVTRLLAKAPTDRPASAREVRRALGRCRGEAERSWSAPLRDPVLLAGLVLGALLVLALSWRFMT